MNNQMLFLFALLSPPLFNININIQQDARFHIFLDRLNVWTLQESSALYHPILLNVPSMALPILQA